MLIQPLREIQLVNEEWRRMKIDPSDIGSRCQERPPRTYGAARN